MDNTLRVDGKISSLSTNDKEYNLFKNHLFSLERRIYPTLIALFETGSTREAKKLLEDCNRYNGPNKNLIKMIQDIVKIDSEVVEVFQRELTSETPIKNNKDGTPFPTETVKSSEKLGATVHKPTPAVHSPGAVATDHKGTK